MAQPLEELINLFKPIYEASFVAENRKIPVPTNPSTPIAPLDDSTSQIL